MGFAVLFKIFFALFVIGSTGVFTLEFQYVFAIIAAITMTVGNLVAISQSNIKRMLAYSSVAQAGYIMIALAVMSQYATTGALFHMFTHVVMKGGAFIMVAALITAGLGEKIEDYKGLAKRAPLLAAAMMLFLFSLAGIPPLAGFTSKFVLFSGAVFVDGAVSMQWMWLAFIAVINSAISLYYYARVVKTMYIEKPTCDDKLVVPAPFMVAIALCVVGVIVLGVYPELLLDLCAKAAAVLF
jgi:NADH-quinone oxidoreductase subunit N